MATNVYFKRIVRDFASLEPSAEIAIGTTGFSGDGQRLFIQHNGVGLLMSNDDARDFLRAAMRAAAELGVEPSID
ncbi:hypothetical protein ACFQ14_16795 [Pseudahrensia aquimaris]|uniref:Uncharacterized protein n=1 Tax=Pseudahrensia aquimaris TaxID=744461 RepID=A0ABW3FKK0_9HYPH